MDPAPLALNGLTQELLQRLATAGCSAVAGAAASSPGTLLMITLLFFTSFVHYLLVNLNII